jgi:hypothetical protein
MSRMTLMSDDRQRQQHQIPDYCWSCNGCISVNCAYGEPAKVNDKTFGVAKTLRKHLFE